MWMRPLNWTPKTLRPKAVRRIREVDEFRTPEEIVARTCRVTLTTPSRMDAGLVVFTCNMPEGHEGDHTEKGRVRDRRHHVKGYVIRWAEIEENEVWRTE